MKYGIYFLTASLLLVIMAVQHGGWYWLFVWPALSLLIISLGYLFWGPRVYCKTNNGRLAPIGLIVLFPYLLYVWSVWHIVRALQSEPAFQQLTDNILIGRRLCSFELPPQIKTVVDLTCEFNEPAKLRGKSYLNFPILDGDVPQINTLAVWVETICRLDHCVYIHCAQGHGRTGLVAAAVLLRIGRAHSAGEAVAHVQQVRPKTRFGRKPLALLKELQQIWQPGRQ